MAAEDNAEESNENSLQVAFKNEPGLSRLESLPPEILQRIFKMTKTTDLKELRLTSKTISQRIEGYEDKRFKQWKLNQRSNLKIFSKEVKFIKDLTVDFYTDPDTACTKYERRFLSSLRALLKRHKEIESLHFSTNIQHAELLQPLIRTSGRIIRSLNFDGCPSPLPRLSKDLLPRLETLKIEFQFEMDYLTDEEVGMIIGDLGPNLIQLTLIFCSSNGQRIISPDVTLPKLTKLELTNFTGLSNLGLFQLLNAMPNLEELALPGALEITGEGVSRVRNILPRVKKLDFQSCENLTAQGLSELLSLTPNVEDLNLQSAYRFSGEGVSRFCRILPKLTLLDVSYCNHLTAIGLSELLSVAPNLKELELSVYCPGFSGLGISSVCRSLPKLTHLRSDMSKITDQGFSEMFSIMPNIQMLYLRSADNLLGQLVCESLPELCELSLVSCDKVTDHGLGTLLSKMPNLKSLVLADNPKITEAGWIMARRQVQKISDQDNS